MDLVHSIIYIIAPYSVSLAPNSILPHTFHTTLYNNAWLFGKFIISLLISLFIAPVYLQAINKTWQCSWTRHVVTGCSLSHVSSAICAPDIFCLEFLTQEVHHARKVVDSYGVLKCYCQSPWWSRAEKEQVQLSLAVCGRERVNVQIPGGPVQWNGKCFLVVQW